MTTIPEIYTVYNVAASLAPAKPFSLPFFQSSAYYSGEDVQDVRAVVYSIVVASCVPHQPLNVDVDVLRVAEQGIARATISTPTRTRGAPHLQGGRSFVSVPVVSCGVQAFDRHHGFIFPLSAA